MSKSVIREDLFSILHRYEERIKKAENAITALQSFNIDWIAPSFASGWSAWPTDMVNYAPGYYRNATGLVMLRGLVSKSTRWTIYETIFTLPAGYRPLKPHIFPTVIDEAFGGLSVSPSGIVQIRGGTWASSTTWVALDNVAFWAEA